MFIRTRSGIGLIGALFILALVAMFALWVLGSFVKFAWLLATSKIGLGILVVSLLIYIFTKERPD